MGDFESCRENRGLTGEAGPRSFRWVHGIAGNEDMFSFADAGNQGVLVWNGTLGSDRDSDVVIGQENFAQNGEFPQNSQGASRLRFR